MNCTLQLQAILSDSDQSQVEKAAALADSIRRSNAYRWTGIYEVDTAAGLVSNFAWSGPRAPLHPVFPIHNGLA